VEKRKDGRSAGMTHHHALTSSTELKSRSLDRATTAFRTGDVALSREAHTPPSPTKRKLVDEPHKSNILKVYKTKVLLTGVESALAGIALSSFTLVGMMSAFGTTNILSHSFVTVVSITVMIVVICSGIYLAVADASYTRAAIAFYNSEKKRETWEYDNYIEGEQREMVELYTNKGMSQSDAENVVTVLSKYKGLFVDIMMAEELQLSPVDDLLPPLDTVVTMLTSHLLFGLIPLLPLLLSELFALHFSQYILLLSSFSLVVISLSLLSLIQSQYTSSWTQHSLTNLSTTALSIVSGALIGSYFGTNWL